MMKKPDVIDMAEEDLDRLIMVGKKQGLTSWDWEDILLRRACVLHNQATAEYRAKGGN